MGICLLVFYVAFFAASRIHAQACTPRPLVALYAPARVPFLPSRAADDQGFHVVLAFEAPFDLSGNCTDAQYSCLLGVGGDGAVQGGSAQQLDAGGALFKIWITASSEGTMQLMLKEDPCDPNTRPHFAYVQVDWEVPKADLLLTGPRLTTTNTSFQVEAVFSEPILPLGLSSLFARNAAVKRLQRLSPQLTRFQLQGSVGADAQVWLPGYTDYAGNRGGSITSYR
ncbi:hypothetical protein DUNSADRAFT_10995 [Dunaliella salina]|uniref:Uncharacterized protein n=1 Tax=Dunaliella salina TaxID=3046 RepID=A0ABQ7GEB7_DUNSA|nr:hypothetical protein DUNSADRAFT_10995 [Dunaliella salina]|eukprot:KAF5832949.1 hypothetical protein DUNSADRAFT_10995 [Dunaliella salina]